MNLKETQMIENNIFVLIGKKTNILYITIFYLYIFIINK